MSFPKILVLLAVVLFGTIGVVAFFKGSTKAASSSRISIAVPVEVELDREVHVIVPNVDEKKVSLSENSNEKPSKDQELELPEANRIEEFFNKGEPKFPIVETITYKSRVPWQKGRPAWLSDYASHYSTSRHFIARSLNGKSDYFKQDVAEGDRFNVFNPNKNINFYLLIDTSRSKMWFYFLDQDSNERVLVKTYRVGLGRLDPSKMSGMLTPLGKYSLGTKIAIYKPKMTGFHQGQKVEMIRIFGTRWIPFEKEISCCTETAAGLGIHGVPWILNEKGMLVEDINSLGKYESDGCIRLATDDIEELFSIIITRPTIIELVKDFHDVKLPGNEKKI